MTIEQYIKSISKSISIYDIIKKMLLTDRCGIEWQTLEDYILYGDSFVPLKFEVKSLQKRTEN